MKTKALILATNAGAYCYPWANNGRILVTAPYPALLDALELFDKIIMINGLAESWLFHPAIVRCKEKTNFFLWDPARCPLYAPEPPLLAQLKAEYPVYSFQQEDCEAFDLRFNSTMYAPPPEDLLPKSQRISYDAVFLGVPKDRLPLLRALYQQLSEAGLRLKFQIGLTAYDTCGCEQAGGWSITRQWISYPDYLAWVNRSRAIVDIYQAIQTGYSLRVMEHIYLGKKLITNNAHLRQAEFYHPNNIFILEQDDLRNIKEWLAAPFEPISDTIKDYYHVETWINRFL